MCDLNVRSVPSNRVELIEFEDLNLDSRVNGFCESTMTLLFKSNLLFNSTLLPPGVLAENASTETALVYSLACQRHPTPVSYITTDMLDILYHVIDNPEVAYDPITKSYYETFMFYIDRETMTGVIIGNINTNTDYHPVHGIFAPRGYGKIECYNNFNELYLTDKCSD